MVSRYATSCLAVVCLISMIGCRHIENHFGTLPSEPPSLTYCINNKGQTPKSHPKDNTELIASASADAGKKAIRNDLIAQTEIDIRNSNRNYVGAIYQHGSTFDTVMDLALLGTTAATSVVGGVAAKADLGAVATGITGVKSSVSKNFFNDVSRVSMFIQISKNMETQETAIDAKLDLDYSKYSLAAACRDLDKLYGAGTAIDALNAASTPPLTQPANTTGTVTSVPSATN
jgi:hypothetical protein